jgi:hypothetical protein
MFESAMAGVAAMIIKSSMAMAMLIGYVFFIFGDLL